MEKTRIPWFNVNIYIEDVDMKYDCVIIALGKQMFIRGKRIIFNEFKDFNKCLHWNNEKMIENIKKFIEEKRLYDMEILIHKIAIGVYVVFITLLK